MESCAYFDSFRCRSCSLLEFPESERASRKDELLTAIFSEFVSQGAELLPPFRVTTPFPSRSRAKLSVTGTVENPIIGLVDREYQGIELLNCPLHFPEINAVINYLPEIIRRYRLEPYDISARTGELKGIMVRTNAKRTELALRFVVRSHDSLPSLREAAQVLKTEFPALRVISANIQPQPAAIPEGPEEVVLTEESLIWEHYGEVSLALAPQSFSQVTHETAEALYLFLKDRARASCARSFLDLFCGVGGISLQLAEFVEWGIGIEVSEPSISAAQLAAERGGFSNVKFVAADVESSLRSYAGESPELIIVNPPRRGLSPEIIARIKLMNPATILYSSCNPETLVRDLRQLAPEFQVKSFKPFDMFPLTDHWEVVAELTR